MVIVEDAKTLKKSRAYIEPADVLLIDLEGDQLGPNGEITLMQVNTYENNYCFLIDIKLLGDDELRNENGWLRKLFESDTKVILLISLSIQYLVETKGRANHIFSQSMEPIFTYTIGDWLEMRLGTNSPPLLSVFSRSPRLRLSDPYLSKTSMCR